MASASLGEAERGVRARLAADATLAGIVGLDAANEPRIYPGWPLELLTRPEQLAFPRITLLRVAGDMRRPARGEVRIRLDYWSWDDVEQLDAMDARATELLDEQHWEHDGAQLYAFSVGSSDRSGRAPRSRLHTFEVRVT